MLQRKFTSRVAAVVLVFGIIGRIEERSAAAEEDGPPAEIPAVQVAGTQAEAIRQARDVDLPLLESADRAVINGAGRGKAIRSVTLARKKDIQELRQALRPKGSTERRRDSRDDFFLSCRQAGP